MEGEWGWGKRREGKEGDKGESLTWRQTAFQEPAANHRHTHTHAKYRHWKWHRSPFGDFPSSKIRLDICPPPLLPASNRRRFPDKNSWRKYSNTLLFCRECLLTAMDLRGYSGVRSSTNHLLPKSESGTRGQASVYHRLSAGWKRNTTALLFIFLCWQLKISWSVCSDPVHKEPSCSDPLL